MKENLFEHIGGNQFKLREEEDYSMDAPSKMAHDAKKQFSVNVGGQPYYYSVTKIPDGTFHHYIDNSKGESISIAAGADPKRLLTQDEVKAEVVKGLQQFAIQQKKPRNPIPFRGRPRL